MAEEDNLPLPDEEAPREDPGERFRRLLEESETDSADPQREAEEGRPPTWDTPPSGTPRPPEISEAPTERLDLTWGAETAPREPALPDEEAGIPIGEGITPPSMKVPDLDEEPDGAGREEQAAEESFAPQPDVEETDPGSPLPDTPPSPPSFGQNQIRQPAVDEQGMPLPRRVDQVDPYGTRVSQAAYQPPPPPPSRPVPRPVQPAPAPQPEKPRRPNRWWGCLVRLMVYGGFLLVLGFIGFSAFALYQYFQIAATLPSVDDLRARASQFETSTILDRNGNVLYEIVDPNAGRRTYVSLDEISPFLIAATIATEDKAYYSHPGFDPLAILRAFWQNWRSGETVSGASTITQQLARILLFDPEERYEQTYMRKVREALLANEIDRRYTKEEVLELYLNEINYGNLAYGIEAASRTYFDVPASQLTLGQAAFLAGLPQAPAVYDIYTNPDAVIKRLQSVLILMYETSLEQNCIFVSTDNMPVCVDNISAAEAFNEIITYEFERPDISVRYPHWVTFVRAQLEQLVDAQTIYRSGFVVHTTIDPELQDKAEEIVARQVASLADRNAGNGALIALDPANGEVLAMVGSADFFNEEIDGQVNMTLAPRQPGSAIKPLVYLAAFEKGWTPSTLIWDVPSEFPPSGDPNDPRDPYKPVNYDERFHGPVTVRSALANSYNIPAVKALDFVGIYDDPVTPGPDGLISLAERLGITTLTRQDYGLSLSLGGGEVPLLELAGAYQVLANAGRRIPPVAITRIEDRSGNLVFEYNPPAGDPIVRSEHAFLLSSILSDNAARTPAFGPNSILNLPFPATAKTGTTNDFRDNWTMGYTTDVVVGVWVGNADNSPMINTSGLTGAAPIFAEFMVFATEALSRGQPDAFVPPPAIVERVICSLSGAEPSRWCPGQRSEFFAVDQLPQPASEDLWKEVLADTWTGLTASPFCTEFTEERLVINTTDPWARRWIRQTDQGESWAEDAGFERPFYFPRRDCEQGDPQPTIWFISPSDGAQVMTSTVDLVIQVTAPDGIQDYRIEWGEGDDPQDWNLILRGDDMVIQAGEVGTWVIEDITLAGRITLRLYVDGHDGYAERRIQIELSIPTPTPTPTPTETPTPVPTETPTPTLTPTETPTPGITPSVTIPIPTTPAP